MAGPRATPQNGFNTEIRLPLSAGLLWTFHTFGRSRAFATGPPSTAHRRSDTPTRTDRIVRDRRLAAVSLRRRSAGTDGTLTDRCSSTQGFVTLSPPKKTMGSGRALLVFGPHGFFLPSAFARLRGRRRSLASRRPRGSLAPETKRERGKICSFHARRAASSRVGPAGVKRHLVAHELGAVAKLSTNSRRISRRARAPSSIARRPSSPAQRLRKHPEHVERERSTRGRRQASSATRGDRRRASRTFRAATSIRSPWELASMIERRL